jgi:hypothetical protein
MAVPALLTTKLRDRKHRYLKARDALRELPRKLEADIAAVERDEDLPGEIKERRIKKLRADASRKWPALRDEAARALEEAEDLVRRARTGYKVDSAAQSRVRHLLHERGVTPIGLLDQARSHDDLGTIAALRAELLYWGNEGGFTEAQEAIAACEQALAELDVGDYAEQAQLSTDLRTFVEELEPVVRFAMFATEGTNPSEIARARMTAARALGEDGQEGENPFDREEPQPGGFFDPARVPRREQPGKEASR